MNVTPPDGNPEAARAPQFVRDLYELRPWYHDFSALGLDTTFLQVPLTLGERYRRSFEVAKSTLSRIVLLARTSPSSKETTRSVRDIFRRVPSPHLLNQPVKEKHIVEFIGRALSELSPQPACLELFCADGYYSCRLATLSPQARVTGVDLDPDHIQRAETIARYLRLQNLRFQRSDVGEFLAQASESYDLVLCAGGLYHSSDPRGLLEQIGRKAAGYVVLQSVVTLKTEDPDYFVQPAPGWQHGSRFTHAWLVHQIEGLGWRVLDHARDQLPGNRRLHDRGASFFLCRVA